MKEKAAETLRYTYFQVKYQTEEVMFLRFFSFNLKRGLKERSHTFIPNMLGLSYFTEDLITFSIPKQGSRKLL